MIKLRLNKKKDVEITFPIIFNNQTEYKFDAYLNSVFDGFDIDLRFTLDWFKSLFSNKNDLILKF